MKKPKKPTIQEALKEAMAQVKAALASAKDWERIANSHAEKIVNMTKLSEDWKKRAEERALDSAQKISDFKQEVLLLTSQNAELRGYVQRTLEDDKVREGYAIAADKPPPMSQNDRGMAHDRIEREYRMRAEVPPVRLGPASMQLMQIVRDGGDMSTDRFSHRTMTAAPPQPKHWLDR